MSLETVSYKNKRKLKKLKICESISTEKGNYKFPRMFFTLFYIKFEIQMLKKI